MDRSSGPSSTTASAIIRTTPLILAIGLSGVGWATGGGAAQILFTLFGEVVFNGGAAGIGSSGVLLASDWFSAV